MDFPVARVDVEPGLCPPYFRFVFDHSSVSPLPAAETLQLRKPPTSSGHRLSSCKEYLPSPICSDDSMYRNVTSIYFFRMRSTQKTKNGLRHLFQKLSVCYFWIRNLQQFAGCCRNNLTGYLNKRRL